MSLNLTYTDATLWLRGGWLPYLGQGVFFVYSIPCGREAIGLATDDQLRDSTSVDIKAMIMLKQTTNQAKSTKYGMSSFRYR